MRQQSFYYKIPSIIRNFQIKGILAGYKPFGSGHIHDTFLIRTQEKDQPDYILQRINNVIFRDIPALMENISKVTTHLQERLSSIPGGDPDRESLTLITANDGKMFYEDSHGNFWRMYVYINDSFTYQKVGDAQQAYEAGRITGRFQSLLSDLDTGLYNTIPGFHDLDKRKREFDEAAIRNHLGRLSDILAEQRFVNEKYNELRVMSEELKEFGTPLRVTHNDTKFNNILFDRNGHALCLIDLDTVMPGYIHYDFGDAIRTIANTALEDEQDLQKVQCNSTFFEAFTKGYLQEAECFLTPIEKKWLPFSPKYMTFLIGLRFLTDYLNGDVYFKIQYPGHNLQRARVQFRMLRCLEEHKSS